MFFFKKADHFGLPVFVSLEKGSLVGRNIRAARRIRIGQRWVAQKRFEGAITREFGFAEHRHLFGVERQQISFAQKVVVIFLAHRGEGDHRTQPFFQIVGVSV